MVEPVTGGLIAGGLLSAAGGVLGAVADLHGLGATGVIRLALQRFDAAPDEAPVFYQAIWRAAVRATHGCVQQVYTHTDVTDAIRGDTPAWEHFCVAHDRVRTLPEWRDAPTLPQALQDSLTRSLPQTLRAQVEADAPTDGDAARALWNSYRAALRQSGLQEDPPAVIRQAFFGERQETKVWPWSRHFALRIGEQLRSDAGFKAMFDAEQFAGIGSGIARLISDFAAAEQQLSALSATLEAVQGATERTEQNTLQLRDDSREIMGLLRDIQSKLPPAAIGLNEEIERLRQRPDIRIEDLVGWLQTALKSSDPLPPEALPKLLQQALTVDLPKLRAEVERYRLDLLASPEAQPLLDEARALLRSQSGSLLNLQEASEKLKALEERVHAECTARRRDEEREMAQRRREEDLEIANLRVLRADAERAMANHATAAELMEQAASLCHDEEQARDWNERAAQDWLEHGELHPGVDAFHSAIKLLHALLVSMERGEQYARLYNSLGQAQCRLGERLNGDEGLQALQAAMTSFRAALEVCTREAMPVDWAIVHRNLGVVQDILGERLGGDVSLRLFRAAVTSFRAVLEVRTREAMPEAWAMTQCSLGSVQMTLGKRLDGDAGLQALWSAVSSYRDALEVYTREAMPEDWAMTQVNLGFAQMILSERLGGEAGLLALRTAVMNYCAALEVHTREAMPVKWAATQNNLGAVQRALGECLDGDAGLQVLQAAMTSYHAALEVYTREVMPADWARSQNNLGNTQLALGKRLSGDAKLKALQAAVMNYRAALEVCTREAMPVDWATTLANLGASQVCLGERLSGDAGLQALQAAVASLNASLEVHTREAIPVAWARTQDCLGVAQLAIGRRLGGNARLDALQTAATCFLAALEVHTREAMPMAWAATQNNLGSLQLTLSQHLRGGTRIQVLRMAKASFHAALGVFTREASPADWNDITRNLNMVEKLLAERGG